MHSLKLTVQQSLTAMTYMTTHQASHTLDEGTGSWLSDNEAVLGLEMQFPWSKHLVEGRKTIEVRSYPLPPELLGRKVYILESQQGKDGVSALGDHIQLKSSISSNNKNLDTDSSMCEIRGWCTFGSIKSYTCPDEFRADEVHHLVSSCSGYAWKEGTTKVLHGWVVKECQALDGVTESLEDVMQYGSAVRRKRSIFQLYKKV